MLWQVGALLVSFKAVFNQTHIPAVVFKLLILKYYLNNLI